MKRIMFIGVSILLASPLFAQELTKQQETDWLNNPDAPIPVAKPRRKINEGNLVYLASAKYNVMHSENKIHIKSSSLQDGWVDLDQCYRQLDAFPRVQIVYKYRNIRNLKLIMFKKMDSAKVQGKSVQLVNVKKGATLCVKAQVQSFQKTPEGFRLKNGPFRRKFLDGYFPLKVSVSVTYPAHLITLAKVLPKARTGNKGLQITKHSNRVRLDATFEGVLNTQIDFVVRQSQ